MTRKTSLIAAAVAVALGGSPFVAAAQQAGTAANTLDTVIVTGTRVADRTVAESQSPIDIITPEALQATGTTELATALARALPRPGHPRRHHTPRSRMPHHLRSGTCCKAKRLRARTVIPADGTWPDSASTTHSLQRRSMMLSR